MDMTIPDTRYVVCLCNDKGEVIEETEFDNAPEANEYIAENDYDVTNYDTAIGYDRENIYLAYVTDPTAAAVAE